MDPSRSGGAFHPHFSPWLADPEQLQRTLVAHHQTLQEFLARLRAVEDGAAANHLILVGPRGFGKTHLLSLTERYVSGRLPIPTGWTAPAQPWICAFFTEEEYAGQNSLANFLLTLFSKLLESSLIEPAFRLPDQISGEEDQAVVECCFERLEKFYHDRRQRILLVIDNLQKVLQQWTESEHQRLRSFLSRNAFLVVLGSAPTVFEEVLDQKAAFHDFFELRLLPRLTSEQELELLEHRFAEDGRQSDFAARRADLERKIPAIEILTGGNPRLILFLYQITSQATFLDIEVALRRLLEELREYFVRRFDELPAQGRKVLDTMAQMSGPATPTEIAKAARLTQALVNMQLKRLKSGHYVRPVKFQRAKSTRYDITDSLFRIWRQTATVAGRQRFRFLADFLKLYFTPDEVRAMYAQHAQCLCSELPVPRAEITRRVDELYYFQAAGQPDVRYGAFSSRVESLLKIGEFRWAEQEVQSFAAESIKGHDEAGTRQAYRYQAEVHRQEGRTAEALQDIKRLVDIGDKEEAARQAEKLSNAEPGSVSVWWAVGVTQGNLGHHQRALEAFRKIPQMVKPTADNWVCQAIALNALHQWEEARQCARSALVMAPQSVLAWAQLGLAAGHLNDDEQALEAFRKAAEIGGYTANLWTFESIALNNLGRGVEALVAAESALAMEPNGVASRIQLGIAAAKLGQPERALQAFREAGDLGGPKANLWTWQAILLNHLDRREEALHCAESAVSLDPDHVSAWQQLADAAGVLGLHEQALCAFRKVADLARQNASLWTNQAIALNRLGRRAEAIQCAEAALALEPDEISAWDQIAVASDSLGLHDRALEAYRKVAGRAGPTADLWTHQAFALNSLSRSEEALECAEAAVALDPHHRSAWEQLGTAAGNVGKSKKALDAFRQAASLGGPSVETWTSEALALNRLDRPEEALRCSESALAMNAEQVPALVQLGAAAESLGQYERALDAYRRAAEVGGATSELWTRQAVVAARAGRWHDTIHCAKAALEIDPRRGSVWLFLGQALINLREDSQALDALRRAAEYMEPCVEVFLPQAFVLQRLGMWKEALASAEAALALNSEMPLALQLVGFAAASLGQTDRACVALRKSVELGGPNADALMLLANCLYQAGRLKDALSAIDESLALKPDSAEAWLTRGWILGEERRFEDALECVERARLNKATDRDYYHAMGDLNLLGGAFTDALGQLESGLKSQPDDWDLQADHTIASGCLGWHGPLMEALPPNLNRVNIPPQSTSAVCEFMFKMAANCLRRGEIDTARGLLNANLEMNSWHASDWYPKLLGGFLRHVIDISPTVFPAFVDLVSHKTLTEDTRSILDPFVKAKELLETRDLTILERLFPEVRELVLDVVRRVEPAFYDSLRRFA